MPVLWFLWEGRDKAGGTGLGPASLGSFSGLWGKGTVPGCWYQMLGVMRAGVREPIKEVAGRGLHTRGVYNIGEACSRWRC